MEDDPGLAEVLGAIFERHGMETSHASTAAQAIALSTRAAPDLLVLDLGLPGTDGVALVDSLRRRGSLKDSAARRLHRERSRAGRSRRLDPDGTAELLTKGGTTPDQLEQRVVECSAASGREVRASIAGAG